MSTRSTTHFVYGLKAKPEAIIYRHSDGYPEAAGKDLLRFLMEVAETVQDTRFTDASYLAAKYVVFLAREFSVEYDWSTDPMTTKPKASRLDFISVGVVNEDPGDIEYRYIVDCDDQSAGRPAVWVETVGHETVRLGKIEDVLAKVEATT